MKYSLAKGHAASSGSKLTQLLYKSQTRCRREVSSLCITANATHKGNFTYMNWPPYQDIVQPLLGMDGVVQLGGPASIKTLNNQRVDEGFAYPCPSVYLSASAVNKLKGLVTHIKSPLPPVPRTSPSSFPFPLPGNPTQKCWKR